MKTWSRFKLSFIQCVIRTLNRCTLLLLKSYVPFWGSLRISAQCVDPTTGENEAASELNVCWIQFNACRRCKSSADLHWIFLSTIIVGMLYSCRNTVKLVRHPPQSLLEICLLVPPKEFPVVRVWLRIQLPSHPQGIVENGDWGWACVLIHSDGTTRGHCEENAGDSVLVRAALAASGSPQGSLA